jgi:hypothetical protein
LTARAAPALDHSIAIGVVVVGELLTALNLAGTNPDHAVLDIDLAVRATGVVDEPGEVSANARVDHGPVGELEAPDVTVPYVSALPNQAFTV